MNVAIVGMACMFPGAPDLDAYYSNLRRGVDSIGAVPTARIAAETFERSDKQFPIYCRRGGFIDAYARFDPLRFGVMPIAAKGTEPDQLLALRIAADALEDAGYADRDFNRERTAVILGRGSYSTAARSRLEMSLRGVQQLTVMLEKLLPDLDRETLARINRELIKQIDPPGADAIISLVPNLTASRISQRLNLCGPAWTVDAACASSLIAVEQGCRELTAGRVDMVLAGGVHVCLTDGFWQVFCTLGALSRSEQIRPFDRRADGLLVGEGVGIVVLKRLEDAERDGDVTYAVLRGIGTSSDGSAATLLSPAVEGQVLALQRAWQDAQLDPHSIGLLEAHGTATAVGDAAELETITRVFGSHGRSAPKPVLGSVKSMIGHAMPAAGAAGLIKAALAVHHGELFPTLHCEEPSPQLAATGFRVIGSAEPWEAKVRRAGVSAFGFGGVNAHAVLEQHGSDRRRIMITAKAKDSDYDVSQFAYFSAPSTDDLSRCVTNNQQGNDGGPARAFLYDPTPTRIARLQEVIRRGQTWHGREQLWFSPGGLLSQGGKVAYLFPGIDATFEPRIKDIVKHLGRPVRPIPAPQSTYEQAFGVMAVNRIMCQVLDRFGVQVDYIAGHSIGEWSALWASGALTEEQFEAFTTSLDAGKLAMADTRFAAAGCSIEKARAVLDGLGEIAISHDNCPHQILLCGRGESVATAVKRLENAGVMCGQLPFQSGFHSPYFAPNAEYFRERFNNLQLQLPTRQLWSATTCAPYPNDVDAIRELSLRHLMEPVRFRELIENLYADGARVFLQVGTGSIINFAGDTLRGRPHMALAANSKERSGLEQVLRLLASLFVEGAKHFDFSGAKAKPDNSIALSLAVPVAKDFAPLPMRAKSESALDATWDPTSALAKEYSEVLDVAATAQREVLDLLAQRARPPRTDARDWTAKLTLSPQRNPELLEHGLFPQRAGWQHAADLFPVVPFTTLVDIAIEHALAPFPGRVAIAAENIRARRWLEVSKQIEIDVPCQYDGMDRVTVSIGENASCTVVMADRYPEPPSAKRESITKPWPLPMRGPDVYAKGRMFHGKAYQGITAFVAIGDNGIDASLRVPSGRGGLLDNAGQAYGFWIQERYAADKLAFPVRAKRFSFFGPPPTVGESIGCQVRIQSEVASSVVANMSLTRGNHVWAIVEDWEDRRFETPPQLWAVFCNPLEEYLSQVHSEGHLVFTEPSQQAVSGELLAGRYLNHIEKAALAAIKVPRERRAILSRILVAKDAIRHYLHQHGEQRLYPAEVHVQFDEHGNLSARTPSHRDVAVVVNQNGKSYMARASERKSTHRVGTLVSTVNE